MSSRGSITFYDIRFFYSLWRYRLIRENHFDEVDHDTTDNDSKNKS